MDATESFRFSRQSILTKLPSIAVSPDKFSGSRSRRRFFRFPFLHADEDDDDEDDDDEEDDDEDDDVSAPPPMRTSKVHSSKRCCCSGSRLTRFGGRITRGDFQGAQGGGYEEGEEEEEEIESLKK